MSSSSHCSIKELAVSSDTILVFFVPRFLLVDKLFRFLHQCFHIVLHLRKFVTGLLPSTTKRENTVRIAEIV